MMSQPISEAQILIVDDEASNIRFLETLLQREGYANIRSTTDARQTLHLVSSSPPDIILLDLSMPYLDGFGVLEQLSPWIADGSYLPTIVLTADTEPETKRKALAAGARDFLTKPLDPVEVLLRIKNLLEIQFQYKTLEEKVRARTRDLEKAQQEIVTHLTQLGESQNEMLGRLAQAAEYRDDDTGQHTYRVGHIVGLLAQELRLSPYQVDLMRRTAPLHDVGKIGLPDSILLKPGPLNASETAIMKTHTTIGARLMGEGRSALTKMAEQIARSHHERWDGSGYPSGLQGEGIPLSGRLVAIADVFDALTHNRPYKKAWSVADALDEIDNQSCRQFDPTVVAAFLRLPQSDLKDVGVGGEAVS
jgi:putative two-component system response regulator